ncbi:MAG TPA: NADH-quinone oxidoreductase subunit A [Bacteroidales bacterium]|nr:NADH-quinone oxidoreductase subunit A [Bacteroidales bacterium]
MDNTSLFVVVLLTGLALVILGLTAAILLSPKSINFQKGETYECGLPTRGTSWMQFRVGYYLYAILFLMFDVETIFLFPWATVVRQLGTSGFISVLIFVVILGLGLAYAWRKGVLKWT